jgi:hypothetical protein
MAEEFHALTAHEREVLLNSGFLRREIKAFDSAKTPSGEVQNVAFNSIPFQKMINGRREWVKGCHASGESNERIRRRLYNYYRGKKGRSPWDFLKVEYQPTDRELTDTEFANKLTIKSAIQRVISVPSGTNYGAPMSPEFRPKGEQIVQRPMLPAHKPTPTIKPFMPAVKKTKKPAAPPQPKRKRKAI